MRGISTNGEVCAGAPIPVTRCQFDSIVFFYSILTTIFLVSTNSDDRNFKVFVIQDKFIKLFFEAIF